MTDFYFYRWLGDGAEQVIVGPFTEEEARAWVASEYSTANHLLAGHDEWWDLAHQATGAGPLELSMLMGTVVEVCNVADETICCRAITLNRRLTLQLTSTTFIVQI